jgi:hypothetical protein
VKRLLPILVLLAGMGSAFAQGRVFFSNLPLSEPPDRTVLMPDGAPVLGSAYADPASFVAQLYWSTDGGKSLTAHTAAPARFRPAGADPPFGTFWESGLRTFPAGVGGVGVTVQLQVRAWDSDGGSLTYDEAVTQGGLHGSSLVFDYTEFQSTPPSPTDYWMLRFTGFTLVPEPSVIGLVVVGAGALFLLRCPKGQGKKGLIPYDTV